VTTNPDRTQRRTLLKRLRPILEWAWFVVLLVAIALYVNRHYDTLVDQLRQISVVRLALSALTVAGGYVLVVELLRQTTEYAGWKPPYSRMYYINALCQLAKYLPGSVWQFVWRAGFYRQGGLGMAEYTRAILLESLWLISSALYVGLLALIIYYVEWPLVSSVLVLLLLWVALLPLVNRLVFRRVLRSLLLRAPLVQLAIWLIFGAGFWLLLPEGDGLSLPLVIGAFGIGWAVGYVAIFAPGGIGVREIVMAAILMPVAPAEQVIVYATVHRFLWLIVEVISAAFSRLFLHTADPRPQELASSPNIESQ
jgi:glycosyltransferase 2 family protein